MVEKRKKIRVLHIITRLDPGGSAENTVLSAERVDPERFQSIVLTGPGLDGSGPSEEYRRRLGDRLLLEPTLVRPIQPQSDIRALPALTGIIRSLRPNIIHLHSAKAGAIGRVAAKWARVNTKVIYTPHGHVFSGYGSSTASGVFTKIEKGLAGWADAIVGLTMDELRAFEKVSAGKREQFCIVPSGVELTPYYPKRGRRVKVRNELGFGTDDLVVGFVGRLTEVKGPDFFIETAGKLAEKNEKVKFLVVGDGDMRFDLQKRAEELNLKDRILWTGWRKDIPHLYSAMDILGLTSRNEGQGRVLVEAMAAETPTVAMSTGGVSEVVEDGATGTLVEAGNVDAMTNALSTLLEDADLRKRLGKAGRKRAEDCFSIDVMINRLELLYQGLLDGQKPQTILPV